MAKRFLFNEFLSDFFDNLLYFGEVHGPVVTDVGVTAFQPVTSLAELQLNYRRTLIPPKKYLLPPIEQILAYTPADGYHHTLAPDSETVLFGLHPCDLAGIAYLDRVFLALPGDECYRRRRKNLILLGISCEADDTCFCSDVGITRPTGFDIFLEASTDGFLLYCGTTKGETILSLCRDLLSERRIPTIRKRQTFQPVPPLTTPEACDRYLADPLLEEFSRRCLSCGACSACCPTCYCFDVLEREGLGGESAERLRRWDNCLFKAHGEVAGGANFRATRKERFRYRFLHKYHGFGPLRGSASCVGCGRCREVCPVRIDLLELFRGDGAHREDRG